MSPIRQERVCKFGDACHYFHEIDRGAFSVQSDTESEAANPIDGSDDEIVGCAAIPLGCHYSLIAIAVPTAYPVRVLEDEESPSQDNELCGREQPLPNPKRLHSGKTMVSTSIVIPSAESTP